MSQAKHTLTASHPLAHDCVSCKYREKLLMSGIERVREQYSLHLDEPERALDGLTYVSPGSLQ